MNSVKTHFQRIIICSLTISFLLSFLIFSDFTIAYAVSYDDKNIGVVETPEAVDDVKDNLNNIIKNGNVKLDISTHLVLRTIGSIDSEKEITKSIISNSDIIEKCFGLVSNNKVCFLGNSKEKIEEKLKSVIYKVANSYEAFTSNDYEIVEDLYITTKKYSDEDIIKTLNIKPATKKKIPETKPLKFKTKVIKDYTRTGSKKVVLQEGKDGKQEITYLVRFLNGKRISAKKIATKVVEEATDKIISVPYKKGTEKDIIPNLTNDQKIFINEIMPEALKLYKNENILPSLTLAQAILESNWGKSSIGKNIFGVKAYADWKGKKSYVLTSEQKSDGTYVNIKCWFKNYDSFGDSVKDYGELLKDKRYEKVHKVKNYRDAAAAVRIAGYATSLDYVDSLVNLIEEYKLYSWDKNPKKVKLKDAKLQKKWNKMLKKLKKAEKDKKKAEKETKTTVTSTTKATISAPERPDTRTKPWTETTAPTTAKSTTKPTTATKAETTKSTTTTEQTK